MKSHSGSSAKRLYMALVQLAVLLQVPASESKFGCELLSVRASKGSLNVPNAPQIQPSDPRYKAYSDAVALLNASMDFTQDPCNNFYEYACNNYHGERSFSVLRAENYRHMAAQMEKPEYADPNTPKPLKQAIVFYEKCKAVRANFSDAIKDGTALMKIMDDFATASGLTFSMVTDQGSPPAHALGPEVLGNALGLLSHQGVDTLITPNVDTDWPSPSEYKFFWDQNTLYYPKSYYEEPAWDTIKDSYKDSVVNMIKRYARLKGITLDDEQLKSDVQDMLNFELALARVYSSSDEVRREYARSVNSYGNGSAYSFVDKASYFKALAGDFKELKSYFKTADFYVMEPEKISELSTDFPSMDSTTVVNYLFFRLLGHNSELLPDYKPAKIEFRDADLGRRPRPDKSGPVEAVYEDPKLQCAYETQNHMQYASARFYMDYVYPTKADRKKVVRSVEEMIDSVLKSFNCMLNHLSWITNDPTTLAAAEAKVTDLIKNVAFPRFILNNESLEAYYADLNIKQSDSYFDMRQELKEFNFKLNYKVLPEHSPVDREDFSGPPGTVNAWYQPELNSITFPAGILLQPFFDPQWPTSLNYGALGVIIGHELSHGFDDQGVQWNGTGALANWMSESAKANFSEMAECVVNQYSGFCPLNHTNLRPACISGDRTQGENIADNAGIHAAWNSYVNHVALNGPDPQLPDPIFGQLTHDQLFFLGFARVWCQQPPRTGSLYSQIMNDPHSPSKYRVLGTIQNFPAFRAAYNCPVGSEYAPAEYCHVWVP